MPRSSLLSLSGMLGLVMLGSLLSGFDFLGPRQLYAALQGSDPLTLHLFRSLRLPRALIAPVAGAALAVAGVLLQSLTRNPLAAPDILGMNAAASVSVVLALFFLPDLDLFWLNLLAFISAGAMALVLLVLAADQTLNRSALRLPLLGSVLSLFFAAITQAVLTLDPATQDQALSWLTGNIAGRSLRQLAAALPWLLAGVVLIGVLLPKLDLFYLDDAQILALGEAPQRLRHVTLLACTLLTAGVVGVVGPIGFIGLLVPRMIATRSIPAHRHRLPLAALVGAILLTAADILARFIWFPDDIPVGAVTALLGGPCFLYLLYRRRGA